MKLSPTRKTALPTRLAAAVLCLTLLLPSDALALRPQPDQAGLEQALKAKHPKRVNPDAKPKNVLERIRTVLNWKNPLAEHLHDDEWQTLQNALDHPKEDLQPAEDILKELERRQRRCFGYGFKLEEAPSFTQALIQYGAGEKISLRFPSATMENLEDFKKRHWDSQARRVVSEHEFLQEFREALVQALGAEPEPKEIPPWFQPEEFRKRFEPALKHVAHLIDRLASDSKRPAPARSAAKSSKTGAALARFDGAGITGGSSRSATITGRLFEGWRGWTRRVVEQLKMCAKEAGAERGVFTPTSPVQVMDTRDSNGLGAMATTLRRLSKIVADDPQAVLTGRKNGETLVLYLTSPFAEKGAKHHTMGPVKMSRSVANAERLLQELKGRNPFMPAAGFAKPRAVEGVIPDWHDLCLKIAEALVHHSGPGRRLGLEGTLRLRIHDNSGISLTDVNTPGKLKKWIFKGPLRGFTIMVYPDTTALLLRDMAALRTGAKGARDLLQKMPELQSFLERVRTQDLFRKQSGLEAKSRPVMDQIEAILQRRDDRWRHIRGEGTARALQMFYSTHAASGKEPPASRVAEMERILNKLQERLDRYNSEKFDVTEAPWLVRSLVSFGSRSIRSWLYAEPDHHHLWEFADKWCDLNGGKISEENRQVLQDRYLKAMRKDLVGHSNPPPAPRKPDFAKAFKKIEYLIRRFPPDPSWRGRSNTEAQGDEAAGTALSDGDDPVSREEKGLSVAAVQGLIRLSPNGERERIGAGTSIHTQLARGVRTCDTLGSLLGSVQAGEIVVNPKWSGYEQKSLTLVLSPSATASLEPGRRRLRMENLRSFLEQLKQYQPRSWPPATVGPSTKLRTGLEATTAERNLQGEPDFPELSWITRARLRWAMKGQGDWFRQVLKRLPMEQRASFRRWFYGLFNQLLDDGLPAYYFLNGMRLALGEGADWNSALDGDNSLPSADRLLINFGAARDAFRQITEDYSRMDWGRLDLSSYYTALAAASQYHARQMAFDVQAVPVGQSDRLGVRFALPGLHSGWGNRKLDPAVRDELRREWADFFQRVDLKLMKIHGAAWARLRQAVKRFLLRGEISYKEMEQAERLFSSPVRVDRYGSLVYAWITVRQNLEAGELLLALLDVNRAVENVEGHLQDVRAESERLGPDGVKKGFALQKRIGVPEYIKTLEQLQGELKEWAERLERMGPFLPPDPDPAAGPSTELKSGLEAAGRVGFFKRWRIWRKTSPYWRFLEGPNGALAGFGRGERREAWDLVYQLLGRLLDQETPGPLLRLAMEQGIPRAAHLLAGTYLSPAGSAGENLERFSASLNVLEGIVSSLAAVPDLALEKLNPSNFTTSLHTAIEYGLRKIDFRVEADRSLPEHPWIRVVPIPWAWPGASQGPGAGLEADEEEMIAFLDELKRILREADWAALPATRPPDLTGTLLTDDPWLEPATVKALDEIVLMITEQLPSHPPRDDRARDLLRKIQVGAVRYLMSTWNLSRESAAAFAADPEAYQGNVWPLQVVMLKTQLEEERDESASQQRLGFESSDAMRSAGAYMLMELLALPEQFDSPSAYEQCGDFYSRSLDRALRRKSRESQLPELSFGSERVRRRLRDLSARLVQEGVPLDLKVGILLNHPPALRNAALVLNAVGGEIIVGLGYPTLANEISQAVREGFESLARDYPDYQPWRPSILTSGPSMEQETGLEAAPVEKGVGYVAVGGIGSLIPAELPVAQYYAVAVGLEQAAALAQAGRAPTRLIAVALGLQEVSGLSALGVPGDQIVPAWEWPSLEAAKNYAVRLGRDWLATLEGLRVSVLEVTARSPRGILAQLLEMIPSGWQRVRPVTAADAVRLVDLSV